MVWNWISLTQVQIQVTLFVCWQFFLFFLFAVIVCIFVLYTCKVHPTTWYSFITTKLAVQPNSQYSVFTKTPRESLPKQARKLDNQRRASIGQGKEIEVEQEDEERRSIPVRKQKRKQFILLFCCQFSFSSSRLLPLLL